MGSGSFSVKAYADYNTSVGNTYNHTTGRLDTQEFRTYHLDNSLDPTKFKVRECVNSDEHPNTIPVILALDVTGSMGEACKETASTLGIIVSNLYNKIKDVEFCIMGIGDLAYDTAPIQMSQFESDVRIAESIDKLYMEKGGGGNGYESYTAAWYMGLKRTKLDCFDKQNRKGIIITMDDEPLNPYLPKRGLNRAISATEEADIETNKLYEEASKKFDIFHIAVDSPQDMYDYYETLIKNSFTEILGDHFKISNLDNLARTIEDCIMESISGSTNNSNKEGISW